MTLAAKRDSASSSSSNAENENSTSALSGRRERLASRSRTVARSAQAALRSSGTWGAAESSSKKWPASARRARTVATIGFVKEPIGNLVSDVTGSPVPASATP
jgi:hypothetical protein